MYPYDASAKEYWKRLQYQRAMQQFGTQPQNPGYGVLAPRYQLPQGQQPAGYGVLQHGALTNTNATKAAGQGYGGMNWGAFIPAIAGLAQSTGPEMPEQPSPPPLGPAPQNVGALGLYRDSSPKRKRRRRGLLDEEEED